MEVVVSFTKSDDSSENVITRGVAVIEWLVSKPVGKGIDTESYCLSESSIAG
jgi:hypothetical protein